MSLPTYAFFYDKEGEVIAKQFVNVGWWLTEEIFVEAIQGLPWVRDMEYLMLYGVKVPKEMIPDDGIRNFDWTKLKNYAELEIKRWDANNGPLRLELQRLYLEQNK